MKATKEMIKVIRRTLSKTRVLKHKKNGTLDRLIFTIQKYNLAKFAIVKLSELEGKDVAYLNRDGLNLTLKSVIYAVKK